MREANLSAATDGKLMATLERCKKVMLIRALWEVAQGDEESKVTQVCRAFDTAVACGHRDPDEIIKFGRAYLVELNRETERVMSAVLERTQNGRKPKVG